MKNILLINPSTPLVWKKSNIKIINNVANPYDLSIVAGILRKGHNVNILDANINRMDQHDVIEYIQQKNPDVLILNTAPMDKWQCYIPDDNYFLDILKQIQCEKIIFGPHATSNPKKYTEYADKIIIGEPESHFPEAIDSKEKIYDIKFVNNLDSLPLPSYDLLPMKKYKNILVFTTRGCPFKCVFCSRNMWGNTYRMRSADNIIEELMLLKDKYGINHVKFYDLEFTLNRERTINLCKKMIDRQLNITWFANVRASSATFDLLKIMKAAGCTAVTIAIESGSDKTLKTIKKDITIEQARKAVQIARIVGIKSVYSPFMIGFPNETYRDMVT